jgi:hypothetical protein
MQYAAKHDLGRLERALRDYPVEKLAAGVRAQNRAMTTVRSEGARRLQPELGGMKIGTIKRQLKQERATKSNPRAILDFSAKRFRLPGNLNIRQFATKWGTGVSVKNLPFKLELADGTPVTGDMLRRLFLQRSRAGAVHAWVRMGKSSTPFQAVVVASTAEAFRSKRLGPTLVEVGRARMAVVLEQEFRFRLSKR